MRKTTTQTVEISHTDICAWAHKVTGIPKGQVHFVKNGQGYDIKVTQTVNEPVRVEEEA